MDKKLEAQLENVVSTIFKGQTHETMPQYQKRQMIFSYLCDNISYDFNLLESIVDNQVNGAKNKRSPVDELHNAVFNNNGICSSISQFYKLLLEQVGIKSHCVICDNGMQVAHQLSLVYDDKSKTYSFDDVTSVIVKLGTKQDFFDYDLESASQKNQGNKPVFYGDNFFVLPEEYINHLAGRNASLCETLTSIPTNIQSVQTNTPEFLPN